MAAKLRPHEVQFLVVLCTRSFPKVLSIVHRGSFLAVVAQHIHLGNVWLATAHLPHPGRPLVDFQEQLASLRQFFVDETPGSPVVLGLDANGEPCGGMEDSR